MIKCNACGGDIFTKISEVKDQILDLENNEVDFILDVSLDLSIKVDLLMSETSFFIENDQNEECNGYCDNNDHLCMKKNN